MVDYLLAAGKGTSIRQSDSLEEGYVDVDMDEVAETYSTLENTDRIIVQRGSADPRTATVAVVRSGLQPTLTDEDWLNNAYLY